MIVATPAQLAAVNTALGKLNAYIAQIQAAQHAAALAGKMTLVQQLAGAFWDANSLEERFVSLQTLTDLASLTGAIASLKQTTSVLDQQKQQVDTWVQSIGIAATVIADVSAVAAAVATL